MSFTDGSHVCFEYSHSVEISDFREFVMISGHWDDFYNGQYYRGNDWQGYPHFENVYGRHFYLLSGVYWQFDDNNQEDIGYGDYFSGGYAYGYGDLASISGECMSLNNGNEVCVTWSGA